jgi:hypothetical protein
LSATAIIRFEPRQAVEELRHLVLVDKENVEGARLALRCQTLARDWREPLEERPRQEDARQP